MLQSMGSQRVRPDLVTEQQTATTLLEAVGYVLIYIYPVNVSM